MRSIFHDLIRSIQAGMREWQRRAWLRQRRAHIERELPF